MARAAGWKKAKRAGLGLGLGVSAAAAVAAGKTNFPRWDLSTERVQLVQSAAAQASRERIAVVVWGGTRDIQQAAYNGTLDARDRKIPIGFMIGPDHDGNRTDALIQIYARSRPQASILATAATTDTREALLRAVLQVHRQR